MFLPDPRAAYERALFSAIVLLGATAVLGGAWLLESMGVVPCHLCLVQRWPYYFGIAAAALALGTAHTRPRLNRALLGAAGAGFLGGLALAVHHSGVELHWWAGPSGCTGAAAPLAASMDAFVQELARTSVVRCDEVSFRLLGLSLANWNLAASLGLAAAGLLGAAPRLRARALALLEGPPARA